MPYLISGHEAQLPKYALYFHTLVPYKTRKILLVNLRLGIVYAPRWICGYVLKKNYRRLEGTLLLHLTPELRDTCQENWTMSGATYMSVDNFLTSSASQIWTVGKEKMLKHVT